MAGAQRLDVLHDPLVGLVAGRCGWRNREEREENNDKAADTRVLAENDESPKLICTSCSVHPLIINQVFTDFEENILGVIAVTRQVLVGPQDGVKQTNLAQPNIENNQRQNPPPGQEMKMVD